MPTDILMQNLVSPITLAFLLGIVATLIRSDLEIPEPVIKIFSIYLLFSIGLQGGQELAGVKLADIAAGLGVTFALILLLPAVAFLLARYVVGLDIPNAAGVAALYGSVSSVTFAVSQSFAKGMGTEMAGYITGLVALLELGILVALFYGRLALARINGATGKLGGLLVETLRGRGLVLLGGGLIIGAAIGEPNFKRIEPFFVELFRGVLVLFILEMGMAAARQMREFASAGPRMIVFAIAVPMLNGLIGTFLATVAGLPLGSAFVIGTVAASASYIDAPAAVRGTFPEANPGIYLTSSLGITFPFMLIAGIPIVYQMALFWSRVLA
ncbi:MAG: sodium-dependent bicarbonate transport family permease [Hyphomicrobiaceae bacterium]|nr:sodium-dependent bicarbonate transport family permease [Hyphomicrobiaceae bacterium]